ncbi:MAG: protein-tyrosine phosphatase family protein [Aestuariivirga sp.]
MIIVCGLQAAPDLVVKHKVGSAIGILAPETAHPVFPSLAASKHLKLTFNDINIPTQGMVAASDRDVMRLINFVRAWDQKSPMLIHCWAGISRSTATAFAAMCILRPDEDEMSLAAELRAASASATPNKLITAKMDETLGRNGRMLRAVESIGRGAEAFGGSAFTLKI